MALVDFILNVAGLLLWLNWCSVRYDPRVQGPANTLAGTLRPTKAPRAKRWMFLAGVLLLVVVRAAAYRMVGPTLNWTPTLALGATALPFRSDYFGRVLLFSALSLGRTLAGFYAALAFLAIVNRSLADRNAFQKLVQLYLGRVGRWPRWILALLVVVLGLAIWLGLQPALAVLGITPRVAGALPLVGEGLLVLLAELLWLRYLVAFFLVGHMLNSYIVLGTPGFWGFVSATAGNLLAPLRRLPLRVGKVDFAPVVMIALVFAGATFALSLMDGTAPHWVQWLARTAGAERR